MTGVTWVEMLQLNAGWLVALAAFGWSRWQDAKDAATREARHAERFTALVARVDIIVRKMDDQEGRTRDFWKENWPVVERLGSRMDSLEYRMSHIEQRLEANRKG